jgi:putative transposase
LPDIINRWKGGVSREVRATYNAAFSWQKSYYERIVRDEKELDLTRNYVVNNVLKWVEDKYYID